MANMFRPDQGMSDLDKYEFKYKRSRTNLLIICILSALNILLLVTNTGTYFIFSAFIPYFIADMGMVMTGRYPSDYYTDELADMEFLDPSFFTVTVVIAFLILGVYLLCWFMSSEHRVGWMKLAFALIAIDTLVMVFSIVIDLYFLIDLLFHIWMIYETVSGIVSHKKWKELTEAQTASPNAETQYFGELPYDVQTDTEPMSENFGNDATNLYAVPDAPLQPDSPILRVADMSVKHRVLLDATVDELNICYRRVKSVNELVINGNVYAEKKGVIEFDHKLIGYVNGHTVIAGLDGTHSYISVDGKMISRKLRLI